MHKNSNKNLYSDELFKVWAKKKDFLPIESYFIKKYISDKKGKIIEAGTGGGRIIFEIEKMGFKNLEAFDFVRKMVDYCNKIKKESNSNVNFKVADATKLEVYKNNTFDYLIYLQQILCFVGKENLSFGLKEAHRIGNENAIFIFSFLNWNSKWYNSILSLMVNFFRILRNEKISKYELPWLNIDNKFNWNFLSKNQPNNQWFKEKDVIKILRNNGFSILELKTKVGTKDNVGHLHIACKKTQD